MIVMDRQEITAASSFLVAGLFFTLSVVCCHSAQGPQPDDRGDRIAELLKRGKGYFLRCTVRESRSDIGIPRDWLIPPEDEAAEKEYGVDSFVYDPEVTTFPIGNGKLGLRLSSFAMQESGSGGQAAGRDIFLVLDPSSMKLIRGGLDLGITKSRSRGDGCFQAKATHFVVHDIDRDGLADLGVISEKLECEEDPETGMWRLGPYFRQDAVKWYLYKDSGWKLDPLLSGMPAFDFIELPLVRITMSPLDYAAYSTWRTYDPARWKSKRPQEHIFVPAYRRALIEKDRQKNTG